MRTFLFTDSDGKDWIMPNTTLWIFALWSSSFIYCQVKMAWRLTCKPFTCLHDMFSTPWLLYVFIFLFTFLNPKIISWIHKWVIKGDGNNMLKSCSHFFKYIGRAICIEGSSVLTIQQMQQWWGSHRIKEVYLVCVIVKIGCYIKSKNCLFIFWFKIMTHLFKWRNYSSRYPVSAHEKREFSQFLWLYIFPMHKPHTVIYLHIHIIITAVSNTSKTDPSWSSFRYFSLCFSHVIVKLTHSL